MKTTNVTFLPSLVPIGQVACGKWFEMLKVNGRRQWQWIQSDDNISHGPFCPGDLKSKAT